MVIHVWQELLTAEKLGLADLLYTKGAAFNHGECEQSGCLAETHKTILNQIELWTKNFNKPLSSGWGGQLEQERLLLLRPLQRGCPKINTLEHHLSGQGITGTRATSNDYFPLLHSSLPKPTPGFSQNLSRWWSLIQESPTRHSLVVTKILCKISGSGDTHEAELCGKHRSLGMVN